MTDFWRPGFGSNLNSTLLAVTLRRVKCSVCIENEARTLLMMRLWSSAALGPIESPSTLKIVLWCGSWDFVRLRSSPWAATLPKSPGCLLWVQTRITHRFDRESFWDFQTIDNGVLASRVVECSSKISVMKALSVWRCLVRFVGRIGGTGER